MLPDRLMFTLSRVYRPVHWCRIRCAASAAAGARAPFQAPPASPSGASGAGASAVKLFPASAVGTGYLKQIAGPFPDIPLVPTGGVSAETAGEWVRAGAVAVGMGSWLIGDGEPSGVTRRSREVVAAVSVPTS